MKRLIFSAWCVAMATGACGPADMSTWERQDALGRNNGRMVEAPSDTLLPTEVGADGYAAERVTGMSGVGPDGSATYALPLWLPTGRAGIQPDLSLRYSSNGSNGSIGRGWSLSVKSRITRCSKTVAQDGDAAAITFTSSDVFCLDGQRLVAVQGVYGASNTEYRTEEESFAKVVSLSSDAWGPLQFRVYEKSGRILTYGLLHGSTFAGRRVSIRPTGLEGVATTVEAHDSRFAWALAKVEDRSGNSITYHYTVHQDAVGAGYEQTLDRISYTASSAGAGMAATRFVELVYESRPDAAAIYVSGLSLKMSRRLREIHVSAPNPTAVGLVRTYRFTYTQEALSKLSLLRTFQDCDGAGVCLRPITFDYTENDPGFEEVDTGFTDLTQGVTYNRFWVLNPIDANGDGRDDLLYRTPYDSSGRYKWNLRLSAGAGQFTTGEVGNLPLACWEASSGLDGRWVDTNLDGFIDVSLEEYEGCVTSPPRRLKHFQKTNQPPPSYNWYSETGDDGRGGNFWYAELNGDGYPDLVREARVNDSMQLGYRLNVGGTLQSFHPIVTSVRNDNAQMVVDLEGTGKSSLLILEMRDRPGVPGTYDVVGPNYWAVTMRHGVFTKEETTLVRTDVSEKQYLFADLNGDSLPDALRAKPDGTELEILMNTGNGFAEPVAVMLPPGGGLGSFTRDNGIRVFDYNGDGRQDLLLMDRVGNVRTELAVLESQGTGFTMRPLSIPVGQVASTRGYKLSQLLDYDGDGLMDMAQVVDGSLRLYKRKGVQGGLLANVSDSLGGQVRFTYKPMIDSTVYTPGTTCAWPQHCLRKGMWLVSEHLSDAGEHPMRVRQYSYEDGRADLLGHGWIGFGAVTVREVAAGTQMRAEFDNQTRVGTGYPYAKEPRKEVARVALGDRLLVQSRLMSYEYRARSGVSSGTVGTLLPVGLTEEVHDRLVSESEASGLLRRLESTREYDWSYGNVTSWREVVGSEVKTGTESFHNDSTAWLIGLTLNRTVTSTIGGRSVTRTRSFTYQPGTALLASETAEPGNPSLAVTTTYVRDSDGLARQIVRTAGGLPARSMSITYDTLDRTWPVVMSNALGHSVSLAYHGGLGLLAVKVDENGLTTRNQYDGFGRLRRIDAPGLADTTFSYAACADSSYCALTSTTRIRTSAATDGYQEEVATVDRLGRRKSFSRRAFDGGLATTTLEYDSLGRLRKEWIPSPTGFERVATTFTYDNLGRRLRVDAPDGTHQAWKYEGSKQSWWDEKGNLVESWFDAQGQLLRTEDVLATRRLASSYTYAPFGLLESVTNGYGQGPRYTYDTLGRVIQVQEPNSGSLATRYNAWGEVAQETRANGDTTTYDRDVLGRVVTRLDRTGVSRFTWDVSGGLGKVGALLSSSQEGDPGTSLDDISVVYTYDALLRPVDEAWSVEGNVFAFSRTFDDYNQMQRLSYPSVGGQRFAVDYQYKPWGTLERVKSAATGQNYWQAQSQNGLGQTTSELFGNGVVSQRRYDTRGRPLFIETKSGTQARQVLAYEYEANGNPRSRHDRVARTTEDFTYDALDRLKSWTAFQNCGSTAVDFSYDDLGNLLGRTVRQGPGESLSYFYEGTGGAGPHAVSRSSLGAYTYDANGNQLTAPGRTVEYTPFNLPSRITSGSQDLAFRYNALDQRTVKRSSSGDVTFYVGGLYEMRRSAAGAALHAFNVMGGSGAVAQVSWTTDAQGQLGAQKTLYIHKDHLGSVDTLTDEGGVAFEVLAYEPFGGRRYSHAVGSPQVRGNAKVRQGFTGHEHDEEVGLINMRGRMYDPRLGRFLSADPLYAGPRMSQTLNRYSYVLNNPLRYTDPSGFVPSELPVIIYDSWYGGSAIAGGPRIEAGGVPGTSSCTTPEEGATCEEDMVGRLPGTRAISHEFAYFVMRAVASQRDINIAEVAKGAFLGGIAGAVPFLSLVKPPEGQTRDFYAGYAGAQFAWAGVRLYGAAAAVTGGSAAVGVGGAVSATGAGAAVGAPVAGLGGIAIVSSTVAVGLAGMNVVGAAQAVQMANQAGSGGGGGSSASGARNEETPDANPGPALPESYWTNKKAPTQVQPGTRRLTDQKPSGRAQDEVYERTTHYDTYGRQVGQTHKTGHGEPAVHPNPHHHTRHPRTGEVSAPLPGVHPDY
ncbi:RHS repeat-associated core domain-containing protein [Myxococcus faecalis]|uniref:RHS repeat-associated core domain-containing protein n=1 Tax=Myxococcus faecalis TaxID=3115646 RepID=UPI003CEC03FD